MADTKLSALTELAAIPANDDEVYIRDVSEAAAQESKRITIANLLAGAVGAIPIIKKAADETVTSSTTLQNDNHLAFSIGANEQWAFLMFIQYYAEGTPDLKIGWSVPVGCTMQWSRVVSAVWDEAEGDTEVYEGDDGVPERGYLGGGIIRNGANVGTIQFQWAQNVSDAAGTIIRAGSCMWITQII